MRHFLIKKIKKCKNKVGEVQSDVHCTSAWLLQEPGVLPFKVAQIELQYLIKYVTYG